MGNFVKVAHVSEIVKNQGKVVEVASNQIALFNVEGAFHAIANTCPHRGGPLGEGDLAGPVVTCPWHGWQFNVTTGQSPVNPAACVKSYNCKIEDQEIFVEIN